MLTRNSCQALCMVWRPASFWFDCCMTAKIVTGFFANGYPWSQVRWCLKQNRNLQEFYRNVIDTVRIGFCLGLSMQKSQMSMSWQFLPGSDWKSSHTNWNTTRGIPVQSSLRLRPLMSDLVTAFKAYISHLQRGTQRLCELFTRTWRQECWLNIHPRDRRSKVKRVLNQLGMISLLH